MENLIIASQGSTQTNNIQEQQINLNAEGTTGTSSPIRNIILLALYIGLLFYGVTLFL